MPTREKNLKILRDKWVRFIRKNLLRRMGSNGHITRQVGTNRLLPIGSTLKCKAMREVFGGWIRRLHGKGRRLTKKLSVDVCTYMREKLGMDPTIPEDEVTRMHSLLKLARKRKLDKSRPQPKPAAMDDMETLPFEVMEDSSAKLLHSSPVAFDFR